MSASLVERLRLGEGTSPDHHLLLEAAAEIERLRDEVARLEKDLDDSRDYP